jgi:hypothetical protein
VSASRVPWRDSPSCEGGIIRRGAEPIGNYSRQSLLNDNRSATIPNGIIASSRWSREARANTTGIGIGNAAPRKGGPEIAFSAKSSVTHGKIFAPSSRFPNPSEASHRCPPAKADITERKYLTIANFPIDVSLRTSYTHHPSPMTHALTYRPQPANTLRGTMSCTWSVSPIFLLHSSLFEAAKTKTATAPRRPAGRYDLIQ